MSKLPIVLSRTTLEQFRRNLTIEDEISMIEIHPCSHHHVSIVLHHRYALQRGGEGEGMAKDKGETNV